MSITKSNITQQQNNDHTTKERTNNFPPKHSSNKTYVSKSLSLIDFYASTGRFPDLRDRIMNSLRIKDTNETHRIISRVEYTARAKDAIPFQYTTINTPYFMKNSADTPINNLSVTFPRMDGRVAKYNREWREAMQFIVLVNRLTDHLQLLIGHLVDDDVKPLLTGHYAIDSLLDIVCNHYETMARQDLGPAPRQEQYLFIREYYEAVRRRMLAKQCHATTEDALQFVLREPFVQGLTRATRIKYDLPDSQTLASYIAKLEEKENQILRENQRDLSFDSPSPTYQGTITPQPTNRFCEVHNRYGNHTTEECIVRQREEKRQAARAAYQKKQEENLDQVIHKVETNENPEERVEILSQFYGHPGSTKLYKTLHTQFTIPNLRHIIETKRKGCNDCQRNLIGSPFAGNNNLGHLGTSTPLKHISSDIFGPFILPSDEIKRYLIAITDRCTRWTQVYPTKQINAKQVIKALTDWITTHGPPETILHDQGLQYTSSGTKDFLKTHNIRQIQTTPYNPTSNSISERINQEIKFVLTHDSQIRITEAVTLIHRRLNLMYHRVIKCTPFELIRGYHPLDSKKTPFDIESKLKEIEQQLQEQKALSEQRNKPDSNQLYVGQEVFYKSYEQGNKLSSLWQGPFPITEIRQNQLVLKGPNDKSILTNLRQIRVV